MTQTESTYRVALVKISRILLDESGKKGGANAAAQVAIDALAYVPPAASRENFDGDEPDEEDAITAEDLARLLTETRA